MSLKTSEFVSIVVGTPRVRIARTGRVIRVFDANERSILEYREDRVPFKLEEGVYILDTEECEKAKDPLIPAVGGIAYHVNDPSHKTPLRLVAHDEKRGFLVTYKGPHSIESEFIPVTMLTDYHTSEA